MQAIGDVTRNHRLGLIFEPLVGGGRPRVRVMALPEPPHRPEARGLLNSPLSYAAGEAFAPPVELEFQQIEGILR